MYGRFRSRRNDPVDRFLWPKRWDKEPLHSLRNALSRVRVVSRDYFYFFVFQLFLNSLSLLCHSLLILLATSRPLAVIRLPSMSCVDGTAERDRRVLSLPPPTSPAGIRSKTKASFITRPGHFFFQLDFLLLSSCLWAHTGLLSLLPARKIHVPVIQLRLCRYFVVSFKSGP